MELGEPGRGAHARSTGYDQRKNGGLAASHRYFGRDLRVGAGYNFTDFSDDLADLDYDHRGAFVNVIGTM